ncbi:MAG TPA: hypothetical protein VJM53_04260 [Burkholderiales bacterium]|jgi:hypothetical protein|nr:hypothetical protein [Burkholderiales bacterium]
MEDREKDALLKAPLFVFPIMFAIALTYAWATGAYMKEMLVAPFFALHLTLGCYLFGAPSWYFIWRVLKKHGRTRAIDILGAATLSAEVLYWIAINPFLPELTLSYAAKILVIGLCGGACGFGFWLLGVRRSKTTATKTANS